MNHKILLILVLIYSCSNKPKVPFASIVLQIDKEINMELVSPSMLFSNSSFMDLYHRPDPYLEDAILIFKNKNLTEQQKYISIFAMQNLKPCNYNIYTQKCYDTYKNGLINANLMCTIVSSDATNENINNTYKSKAFLDLMIEIEKGNTSEVSMCAKYKIEEIQKLRNK